MTKNPMRSNYYHFLRHHLVQISCLNLNSNNIAVIKGEPPKHMSKGIISIRDNSPIVKTTESKTSFNENHIKGIRHLMQAQYVYDYKNIDRAYHHLQMAIEYLKGNRYQNFVSFYFNGLNMIHLKNRKVCLISI